MKIPIELLDTESGTQARAMLNMDTVREYAEAMEGGAQFPPLVVFRDENDNMYVADGFHRAKAAIMIDLPELDCDVRAGDRRSAILHAVGANADHGLPRTIADKRAAVMRMLDDQEWGKRNDWQISQQCCVSAPFVKAVREKRQVAEDAPPDVPHDLREDWADVADKGGDPMVMTDPDKGKVVVDADEHLADGGGTPSDNKPVDAVGRIIEDDAMIENFLHENEFKSVATMARELIARVKQLDVQPWAAHFTGQQAVIDLKNVVRAAVAAPPYALTPPKAAEKSRKWRNVGYITKDMYERLPEDQR